MLQHYPHLQAGKEKKSGSRTNPSHQSCWPAKTQAKLNSLRLFCIMVSFTAQNTRRMFSVSYPACMQREQNGEGERKTGKRNRHMDKQRCQYTKEPRGTKQSVTATHSAKSQLRRQTHTHTRRQYVRCKQTRCSPARHAQHWPHASSPRARTPRAQRGMGGPLLPNLHKEKKKGGRGEKKRTVKGTHSSTTTVPRPCLPVAHVKWE